MDEMSRKSVIWISVLIAAAIFFTIGKSSEDKTTSQKVSTLNQNENDILNENFDSLDFERKEKWIRKYAEINRSQINKIVKKSIKEKFTYPEEVKFDWGSLPDISKLNITIPDEGISFLSGFLTAKNAFGVKSKFQYQVRLIILPGIINVDNISIQEFIN